MLLRKSAKDDENSFISMLHEFQMDQFSILSWTHVETAELVTKLQLINFKSEYKSPKTVDQWIGLYYYIILMSIASSKRYGGILLLWLVGVIVLLAT